MAHLKKIGLKAALTPRGVHTLSNFSLRPLTYGRHRIFGGSVASSLPLCNTCMMFMRVISTCCHFSLNNVPVTYFPVLTRCFLQFVDNRCLLQSLKDSLYFAIFSDCVLFGWVG